MKYENKVCMWFSIYAVLVTALSMSTISSHSETTLNKLRNEYARSERYTVACQMAGGVPLTINEFEEALRGLSK